MPNLIAENTSAKLAVQYEAVRRQEYQLFSSMLEVLPRLDGLPEERLAQLRDALFHADSPYLMVLVGPFSSGKSSLINALLGAPDLLPVGITPTTERITYLRSADAPQTARSGDYDTIFNPAPLLQKVSLVDTPGLESVFRDHDQVTRRFLHRADAVLLVMLATQAMTAGNAEYLQLLKSYGKQVIIVLNQADLLTPEEAEQVREHVRTQSKSQLGYQPEVWLMSARLGMEALRPDGTRDPELWAKSGLDQFERYLSRQLGDVARLRQKLQTPLDIARNVHAAALQGNRAETATLDGYQQIRENINGQIAGYGRENHAIVDEVAGRCGAKFDEASAQASAVVRGLFTFGALPRAVLSGLSDLTGIRRLAGGKSRLEAASGASQVDETLAEIHGIADGLAPRLEGKDVQDIDNLVTYSRRELERLPEALRVKVIGTIQPPVQYDRAAMQSARTALDEAETRVRTTLSDRLDGWVKSADTLFATYTIILLLLGGLVLFAQPETPDLPGLWLFLLLGIVVAFLLGAAAWLVRGRIIARNAYDYLAAERDAYLKLLRTAAAAQIETGLRLRREAVLPLVRLIETQTSMLTEQTKALHGFSQQMGDIDAALAKLN
jgi:GTP-binding protein EngB required for normal cell division